MNTQSDRKNSNYLVILLLVVGLTAFSHSMKKLYEFHQMAADATRMIALWSSSEAPAEVAPALVKVEACENRIPAQPIEQLSSVNVTLDEAAPIVAPQPIKVKRIERRAHAESFEASLESLIAKTKKARSLETLDPFRFQIQIATDHDDDSDDSTVSEVPVSLFKGKNRKHDTIRINPRDREMLLKTLNRGISLRIAG